VTGPWCTATPRGVRLALQLAPNAKATVVIGVVDGALKLKLHARPIEGQANAALVKWLAQTLGVPRGAVTITHGLASRKKLVEVEGVTIEAVLGALAPGD
jgi:uncharacterized protein